jgi:Protein of unknown function (DUF3263)
LNRPEAVLASRAVSSAPQSLPGAGALDERLRAILDFEREWWKFPGPKQRAIRERFGVSSARYHQLLNGLMDRPEALAYDPMLVRRLRRLREARRRKRFAQRLGLEP